MRISPRRQAVPQTVLNSVIVVTMTAFAVIHIAAAIRSQSQSEINHFPVRAAAVLRSHPSAGRLFNHYDWGGYLIWRLYPSTPVFIDGRADVYGQPLLDEFARTYQLKDGWRQTLQEWNIKTVLVSRDSALATGLRRSPDWTLAYEDSQAVILTSSPPVRSSSDRKP